MTIEPTNNDLENIFSHAIQHHQNNEIDKACQLYQKILEQVPSSPLVNYNYGLALFQKGEYEKSQHCYKIALEQAPGETDILYNLALCSKKLGDFLKTVQLYEKILDISPYDPDSLYNLGCCYKDMNEDKKAISTFHKVLELSKNHQSSMNNLAYLYHKNDDHKMALHFYLLLLKNNPEHVQAKHMLAALQGDKPGTAPLGYVEEVFDDYSDHYDDSLVKHLEYDVPNIMRKFLKNHFSVKSNSLKTLDLGCGTGLSGQAFRDISSSLTGVDISQKMLNIAQNKGIYNSLIATGIEEYLHKNQSNYDLVIAADVFTYIGELETVFKLLFQTTSQGAYFCFSVEKSADKQFLLSTTGRYAHSLSYIKRISIETGWKIISNSNVNLRKEKEQWIKGMIFFLQKVKPSGNL